MKAYAIGHLSIHHRDWMEEYTSHIVPLIHKHGGAIIAKGQPSRLEGKAELPDLGMCIEFPSKEAATAWYNDPDNERLIALRQSGSDLELLLVDGATQ